MHTAPAAGTQGRAGNVALLGGIALALLALAWLAGTALQMGQAAVFPVSTAWAGLAVSALVAGLGILGLRTRGADGQSAPPPPPIPPPRQPLGALRTLCAALLLLGVFGIGWFHAELRAGQRLQEALAPALEGRDLVLTGTVAELPRVSALGVRFVLEVESAQLVDKRQGAAPAERPVDVPQRVSLAWFQGWDVDTALSRPALPLVAGDRWRLPVRLKRPHGAVNPHGFDLERWLFEQDLRATGHVRPGAQRLEAAAAHPLERLRQHWRDAILLRVADPAAAGVLAALAVGDQAAIDSEGWELFRITGVAHLMSISGLHITMWAWLAAGVVGWAWRRSPRLMLRLPAQTAGLIGGLVLAALYAGVAGWGVPAQRTVLMLAVVVALRLAGRQWPGLLVLLASAVAVTLFDPWAVGQAGFWLSFFAVGLLMVSEPVSRPAAPALQSLSAQVWRDHLQALLRTQATATVGLAPLAMVFFQQVSVVGFAANLVAIPLVTLLVTPLALIGLLLPPAWTLAAGAVQGLTAFLELLAGWPLAVWSAAAAPPWAVASGLLGGALLVMPLPWRLRGLGLPLMLPLLAPHMDRPPEGRFETVVVDVGQGTAVLVRTAQHLLVYDAGPQYTPEADAGQRVLLPLLRARGEQAVDHLVLSHRDLDHVGGAASLIKALPVRQLSSSLEAFHPLRAMLPTHQRCDAGQRWRWDGVDFEMLHPAAAEHPPTGTLPARPNALSCVLRVSDASGRRLLLTGDIEAAQETALLAREGPNLKSDALLVPHHGSRTSSTEAFIQAVAPRWALAQAAYRSRFGHPAPDVVARYEARSIPVLRTDRCGAWSWRSDQPEGRCERQTRPRYWHTVP
jgi:competence protein ComEC